jgi:hypothetical protein
MYQLTIDKEAVSRPMSKDEAAAWEAILRLNFPGVTILAIPVLCPECGTPLPDSGPCWHNLFEQEERLTGEELEAELFDPIPFDGRAMDPKIITEQDEYF